MVGLDPTVRSLHETLGAAPDGRIKSDHDGFNSRNRTKDTPLTKHPEADDDCAPTMLTQAEVLAIIDRSDLDVVEGCTVPLADVLAELDAAAEAVEARRRHRAA